MRLNSKARSKRQMELAELIAEQREVTNSESQSVCVKGLTGSYKKGRNGISLGNRSSLK